MIVIGEVLHFNIDDTDEIFIEPPEAAVLTDEDSAEEDDGGTLDNLNGRQLRSIVEIKLSNSERVGTFEGPVVVEEDKTEAVSVITPQRENNNCQTQIEETIQKISLADKIKWIEVELFQILVMNNTVIFLMLRYSRTFSMMK